MGKWWPCNPGESLFLRQAKDAKRRVYSMPMPRYINRPAVRYYYGNSSDRSENESDFYGTIPESDDESDSSGGENGEEDPSDTDKEDPSDADSDLYD